MAKKDGRVCSERELAFVANYVRTKDPAAAYKAAGYKWKTDAEALAKGRNLLDPHLHPRVAAAVAERIGAAQGTPVLTGRQVLEYVHRVMTFRPMLFGFTPGGDGCWQIGVKQLMELPAEVQQLIEDVEYKQVDLGEGRLATGVLVRFVEKKEAMKLAAKYQLPVLAWGPDGLPLGAGETKAGGETGVDWDRLMGAKPLSSQGADPVRQKILALEARAADRVPSPQTNGDGKHGT